MQFHSNLAIKGVVAMQNETFRNLFAILSVVGSQACYIPDHIDPPEHAGDAVFLLDNRSSYVLEIHADFKLQTGDEFSETATIAAGEKQEFGEYGLMDQNPKPEDAMEAIRLYATTETETILVFKSESIIDLDWHEERQTDSRYYLSHFTLEVSDDDLDLSSS